MNLAVKYRPQTFADVTEQTITTAILKKQIEARTFKNCYLFAGTSGCGKTTCARIFANEINRGVGEPIEIDGGTISGGDGNMTGAEKVRRLAESAAQRDLVGEYKVIIIDECQNLGGGKKENNPAWAALLKTLEECPKYTIFILCSTDPEKIPTAILNRAQRFNFTPISHTGIKARLEYICQQEGFTNYDKTCDIISKAVHGGMRDAITYLEQVASYSTDLQPDAITQLLGGLSYETMFKLTWALQNKDEKTMLTIIESLYNGGQNLKTFINVYLEFILDLSKFIIFKNIELTAIPTYLASAENSVVQFTVKDENSLQYFTNLATKIFGIKSAIKYDTDIKSTIIVLLLQFIRG